MTSETGAETPPRRAGWTGAAARAIELWALAGGALLLGVVAINAASVIGGVFGAPVPGDFELTEMGVAVAAFAFLPWCQLTGANVTADIFTARASPAWTARFTLAGAAVAFLFALLLLWRMWAGMEDQRNYDYVTAILSVPVWWAFPPILISLVLLALAAAVTLAETAPEAAGRRGRPAQGAGGDAR